MGSLVEVTVCDEVIYPACGAQHTPVVWPRSLSEPIGSPVLSLHVRASLPVPRGPPAQGPACNEEICHPVELTWAQPTPVLRPPFTFGRNLRPGFEFSSCACARPRAAAVEDEGIGLSGVLVSAQHAFFLLPDPRHAAGGSYLCANVPIVMCQVPPPSSCCTRRQSE